MCSINFCFDLCAIPIGTDLAIGRTKFWTTLDLLIQPDVSLFLEFGFSPSRENKTLKKPFLFQSTVLFHFW
jgi:hypothetical protein